MFLALALIITNANVVTLAEPEHARVVGMRDGLIAYVGDDAAAAAKAVGMADVIDAKGMTVVPGFNDAHMHLGMSLTVGGPDGFELPEMPRAAFLKQLAREAAARPKSDWLFCKTPTIPDGVDAAALADVRHPLLIVSSRGGLVNREGLRRIGAPQAIGARGFVRGRDVASVIDRAVHSLAKDVLERGAIYFLRQLAENGITSAQLIIDELPEVFARLERIGELSARIRMTPLGMRDGELLYASHFQSETPDWVRVEGAKYFHDGGARMTRSELADILADAYERKKPLVFHVLSRAAVQSLLTAIEAQAAQHPGVRPPVRFDHVDDIGTAELARAKALGIPICSNPAMIPEWATARAFPMRAIVDAGVTLCIGSDWVGTHRPARPMSPLGGLALAVGRGGFGDAQAITPLEALRAYTVGSAIAAGDGDKKGAIAVGKFADVVVLAKDPQTTPPAAIADIAIAMTIAGGKVVYRSPLLPGPQPPRVGAPEGKPPVIAPARPEKPRK